MKLHRVWIAALAVMLAVLGTGCGRNGTEVENGTSGGIVASGTPEETGGREPSGTGSGEGSQETPVPKDPDLSFEALSLPSGAIRTLEELGLTPEQYTSIADNGKNGALSHLSTVVSPDFSLSVNGGEVPVYSTLAFVGSDGGHGVIQSFATVFVNTPSNFRLNVELTPLRDAVAVGNFAILSNGASPAGEEQDGKLCAELTQVGAYTFLCNDPDQEHAFVLFVRGNVDDEARIAAYRKQYGAERVQVFEAGVHEVERVTLESNSAVYLCKGALLVTKPKTVESEAGLFEMNRVSNVTVAGYGYVEMSLLGHSERIALRSYASAKIDVREVTFVNNGAWNLYVYDSEDCKLSTLTVLGHRMNSDGVNICNSRSVRVENCWVRTGDDCYSGKTLGGNPDAYLMNVTFEGCTAWGGKARCFGVTGEAEKAIVGLVFRNCDILFRDATWDNERLGGLCVIIESGSANDLLIQDVLFENIRIHRDAGRAINVTVLDPSLTGLKLSGIVFRNIVCTYAEMPFRFWGANSTNRVSVRLESVTVNGDPIGEGDVISDEYAEVSIGG